MFCKNNSAFDENFNISIKDFMEENTTELDFWKDDLECENSLFKLDFGLKSLNSLKNSKTGSSSIRLNRFNSFEESIQDFSEDRREEEFKEFFNSYLNKDSMQKVSSKSRARVQRLDFQFPPSDFTLRKRTTFIEHDQSKKPVSFKIKKIKTESLNIKTHKKDFRKKKEIIEWSLQNQNENEQIERAPVKKDNSPKDDENAVQSAQSDDSLTDEDLERVYRALLDLVFLRKPEKNLTREEFEGHPLKIRALILLILAKIGKVKKKQFECRFEDLLDVLRKSKSKRCEEKVKMVYKQVLKFYNAHFKRKFGSFVMNRDQSTHPLIFKCERRSFYFWLFEAYLKERPEMLDFLMDVCGEHTSIKKPVASAAKNWKTRPFSTMKNVSKSFRFLLKSDPVARRRVLKYLELDDPKGLFSKLRREIETKMNSKLLNWKKLLVESGFRFSKFKKKLVDLMNKKGYKSPWTLKQIKKSMLLCQAELQEESSLHPQLKAEFLRLYRTHYSFFLSIDNF